MKPVGAELRHGEDSKPMHRLDIPVFPHLLFSPQRAAWVSSFVKGVSRGLCARLLLLTPSFHQSLRPCVRDLVFALVSRGGSLCPSTCSCFPLWNS